jgi:hypothetical protein
MATFLREWGQLIAAPLQWSKGMDTVAKIVLPGLLTAVGGIALIFRDVPWWIVPLTAVVVFYFSLTAGMAWERSRGPSVSVGDLRLDDLAFRIDGQEGRGLFFVDVRNGGVPAKPRVQIVAASGGIRWIEHAYDAHWRGRPPGYSAVLNIGQPQQFGLLGRVQTRDGNPALFIWDNDGKATIVTRDAPLAEQGILTIEVIVICEAEADKEGRKELGKEVRRTFHIAPEPGSAVGYKVAAGHSALIPTTGRADGRRKPKGA